MATTPNGTVYTTITTTVTGYGTCSLTRSNAAATAVDVPTILYAHGSGGAHNQFMTLSAWEGLRNWLIDNGCAIVEGSGGVDDTAGETNWGNATARLAYVAYLNWAATLIDIGPVVPLGRSMGGLIAPWLYLRSSIASQCVGLIVNSGVQTISYGGSASSVVRFGTPFKAAYGVTTDEELIAASADHDPMNFTPSLWDGKKVLQLVGDADTTVPPSTRGAYPLRALYAGRPAVDLVDVRAGGDHSSTNGSYLQVTAMTEFLSSLSFGTALVVPTPMYNDVPSRWRYFDGSLTEVITERYATA
jgi:pimeloyl-ACP methyl ester carboxylesterase